MIDSSSNNTYDVNESLKVENLTSDDYEEICKRLGRKPNRTELGMFGVMWSEHCCYRNSKPLLANFPTTGKNVLVGPGENAGVIDVGNDQKLVFKIESHNHPSAIEPFQGAATGVGGILRDIFTMGARPIATLNSIHFGSHKHPKTKNLLNGVVSGIGGYGNCMGIPNAGGEVKFNKCFNENNLVTMHQLADAYATWKENKDDSKLLKIIRPVEETLSEIKSVVIRDSAIDSMCHGAQLAIPGVLQISQYLEKGDLVGIYSQKGEIVALAESLLSENEIKEQTKGYAFQTKRIIMKPNTYPKNWRTSSPPKE